MAKKKPSQSIFEQYASNLQGDESGAKASPILPIYNKSDSEVLEIFSSLDWSFAEDDTTYLSHDIHPYPAKFVAQLPSRVIQFFTDKGDDIWDPFGGSGTTALEAALLGRDCLSTDINPIGSVIGKAKTSFLTADDCLEMDRFIEKLEYYKKNTEALGSYFLENQSLLEEEIPEIPNIGKWFSPTVICELSFLKRMIKTEIVAAQDQNIVWASFSKIITKVSNQENETTYRAVDKKIQPGDTVGAFLQDLKSNYAKIKEIGPAIGLSSVTFLTANVMEDIVGEDKPIKPESKDLVVTSPPYPNAFDYSLYHRFRIFWLDSDPREMAKGEIGSHLRYERDKKGFSEFEVEMRPVLVNCFKSLKSGRLAVFVLGNAVFDGKEYDTAALIGKVAESIGFRQVGIVDRPLPENKRSMKSWARRAKSEQILILRKPSAEAVVDLTPVKYKLWPYEKEISAKERKGLTGSSENSFRTSDIYIGKKLKKLTFYKSYSLNGSSFDTWQSTVESSRKGESNRRDPKYLTHGIHAYKGKFYPQLVRPLLNICGIPEGGSVFDPFCGSGTVALESNLNGYDAYGCDINPVAVAIAQAKNSIYKVEPHEFDRQIASFKATIANFDGLSHDGEFTEDSLSEIKSWFPEPVISKMGFILSKIALVPNETIRLFLKVILSSIIREISQQDPTDLRIRRRKISIEDAPVMQMFGDALDEQYQSIMGFHKISNLAPAPFGSANIWRGNSTDASALKKKLPEGGVDIVITSPPYATALPYIDTNRLSMLVLNGFNSAKRVPIEAEMTGTREISKSTREAFEALIAKGDFGEIRSETARGIIRKIYSENSVSNVGFRKMNMAALIYMYFSDMSKVMASLDAILKKGGFACLVIGDTKTTTGAGNEVIIRTTQMLRETGICLGWSLVDDIPITVTTENLKHIAHAITENNILVFRK